MNVQTEDALPEGVTRNADYGYPQCEVDGATVAAYIAGGGQLAMSVTGRPPCDNDAEPTEVAFILTPADLDRIAAMFGAVLSDGYHNPFLGKHLRVGDTGAADEPALCGWCASAAEGDEGAWPWSVGPINVPLPNGRTGHAACAKQMVELGVGPDEDEVDE